MAKLERYWSAVAAIRATGTSTNRWVTVTREPDGNLDVHIHTGMLRQLTPEQVADEIRTGLLAALADHRRQYRQLRIDYFGTPLGAEPFHVPIVRPAGRREAGPLMPTDLEQVHVETRALTAYGAERYEDAVTYAALGRYLSAVGAIPAGAWGTLPDISDQLRRDWATALANRIVEARTIHDEMNRMSDGLLQVATDYENTDLDIALTFDVTNRDMLPYLPVADGYSDSIRTRQGGVGVLGPPTYRRLPDDRPTPVIPPDNERLTALQHETLPTTRVVEEPVTISSDGERLGISGGRTTYYEDCLGDRLDEFVQEHRDTLLQLEALLTELGTGQRLPLSDLIVHAWRTQPAIIRNRADLIHSAANTYAELTAEMRAETGRLKLYWEGAAATAFTQYADTTTGYLDRLHEQAAWLAEEGKKAASLLEGLRNAYAATGYERISGLIQALQDYRDQVAGLFSACSNPEKALIDAVAFFTDYLTAAEQRHVQALADLIKIDEQTRHERPDLGTRGHDTVPFPRPEVGTEAWTDQDGWQPTPDHPTQ